MAVDGPSGYTLGKWSVAVTWTPIPGTYAAKTWYMNYRATSLAAATAKCVDQNGRNAQAATVTYGTPVPFWRSNPTGAAIP